MTGDVGLLAPVWAGAPVEDLVGDRAVLDAMLDAEAALARAQARVGTVPADAAATITAAAADHDLDVRALAVAARDAANPVVALVPAFTAVVARRDPGAAHHVHRGSTSQDVLDTALMLVAGRALDLMRTDLAATAARLGELAAEHRDTTVAARTLGLHAVPTTFGLRAAGWRAVVLDADIHLARVRRGLPCSLGGAAGTLAGYLEGVPHPGGLAGASRLLVEAFAEETGLADPGLPWHARRTPVAELGAALAVTTGALGKLATDVALLSRTEVGEVAEPQAVDGRGRSSAMPQKRNPVLSVLVRGAALQVPALAQILATAMLAEDERASGAWHSEWSPLREALRLAGGAAHAARELVVGLEVRPDAMAANLAATGAGIVAERLVKALAPHLPSPAETLRRAGDEARRSARSWIEILAEDPELAGRVDAGAVEALVDPHNYTGAATALVDRALATAGEQDP